MSTTTESTTAPAPTPTEPPKPAEPAAFAPPASQAELDRIISERVGREKAKYADYDEVKARLATIDESTMTEVQKAQAAQQKAEAASVAAARELSILRAASKHGVPADFVDLIDGADEAAIDAKAEKVAQLVKDKAPAGEGSTAEPDAGNFFARVADPGQGGAPAPDQQAVKDAFARQLFQLP